MGTIDKLVVLVLNKSWQAINVTTPAIAVSMMFAGNATGLEIVGEDNMIPLKWNEWKNLHCTPEESIKSSSGLIKMPKVIILANYNNIPKKRPRFTSKNIWERDNSTCQYTGKKLSHSEGNIDHVIPKSRGGKTDWSNCVLCHKDVNSKKGNLTPNEAGLTLLSVPREPTVLPSYRYIKNKFNVTEWKYFIK